MSLDSDRETARLWRVSKTVHEMIRDRVSVKRRQWANGSCSQP